ncbi:hypothetical protein B0A50_04712 [Salinomyces thailandicus]|uniref:U3 small nucleolar RNA-associated protein 10 n=1 Tax=Salinomyces thailandicus TaxID=706561 RepID=A0A4U0TWD3_9PEZI|nr:hypothetical protein B0A50_04712 [Salinomyces thailandica]
MATSLQQQLAAIQQNSTNQLDLKAQKTRHSKSLLFEPRDAAGQSFDTIYQICYEGFEELCMLDARFTQYARNLFSEQSKSEDRTQMTAGENEELDKAVESFLGLVQGRLLLKPAVKAVEWLVRRFRVQEYSPETMLLTFLPYHTAHIFPTLLSILPNQLPASFRWLHPYVASLQSPPRHAVLAAAINNQGFFSGFSQYALRVTGARNHSAILLGFWASITAQAVSGMVDATRSGRDAIRKQREEDLLLRVLPILQSALSIRGVPELYLGACMIMTILATKASLNDHVLDAMMEAIVSAWTKETLEDGLVCVAVLSEEKQHISLPKSIACALAIDDTLRLLASVAQRHRVGKLVLALALKSLEIDQGSGVPFVRQVMAEELLSEHNLRFFYDVLIARLQSGETTSAQPIVEFLRSVADDPKHGAILQRVTQDRGVSVEQVLPGLLLAAQSDVAELDDTVKAKDVDAMEVDGDHESKDQELESLIASLPSLSKKHPSFLDRSNDDTFRTYGKTLEVVVSSQHGMRQLLAHHNVHKGKLAESPTFLSLLARTACSNTLVLAKVRALEAASEELRVLSANTKLDMQVLIPYAMTGLADNNQRVRRAAASFCNTLHSLFEPTGSKEKTGNDVRTWCADAVYGSGSATLHTLSTQNAQTFLSSALIPILEDCVLDGDHVGRSLADTLRGIQTGGSRRNNTGGKEMKSSIRSEVCSFLASHAAATPALRTKLLLLRLVSGADKTANDARKNVLLPFVKSWTASPPDQVDAQCAAENISKADLDHAVVACLSHRSADELQTLKSIAAGEVSVRSEVQPLAFEHLRALWSSMKEPSQIALADFLLDHALDEAASETVQAEALETLRNLHLPDEILVHITESLPNASDLQDQPSSAKKQRTSKGEPATLRKVNQSALNAAIRRVTLVLELVEASKPEQRHTLLKGLFNLLSELNHYKTLTGSQLVYLQGLLMSCLLSVVNGLKGSKPQDVDRSVIRTDLIVECVRTTSSTQVHNTALLLISSLASWAPELVLHSVMPLFTFMSTTLLRQSDEYSAHVTDQTVARIVPPLAASLKKRGRDLVSGAAELLLSFTAAFEHVPLHRRASLFRHLVQTLGPEESLFAVIAMLVERYPKDERTIPFIEELIGFFPVQTQLHAIQQYIDLIFDTLKRKRTLSDAILGFGEKDAMERDMSTRDLFHALRRIIDRHGALRKKIAKEFAKGEENAGHLRTLYSRILDQAMQLVRDAEPGTPIRHASESILSALLLLTPTKDFIETSAQLMQTGSDETRQQVFSALEMRAMDAERGNASLQETFLDVLPNCCVFVQPAQPVKTRLAAVTCIDQIVDKYGKRDRTAALDAAKVVAGDAALGSEDYKLKVTSTLCLASMVGVLEEELISILPEVFDKILGYAQVAFTSLDVDYQLLDAVFGFTVSVLDHLPWMFSPQYLNKAVSSVGQAVTKVDYEDAEITMPMEFCSVVAKQINPQDLFPAIERTFEEVTALGRKATRQHLSILHGAVQHQKKTALTKNAPALFNVFIQAFDLRAAKKASSEDHTEVFALVDKIALDTVMKLNDTTFRPFYVRLVQWATSGQPKLDRDRRTARATSLYSFSHALFEQLKSIVTNYANYLLDDAADWLGTLDAKLPEERELLNVILDTFSSSFQHDQDDFWQAPQHFEAVKSPIVTQLEKTNHLDVSARVIPAITELAMAAASPEHHKSMNTIIMQYMRDEDAAVRLAAVKCERAITEKLNLDWLSLLPEMLPFISEAQEDDDEEVERETLRWVRQIEEITGESLEGMLQ